MTAVLPARSVEDRLDQLAVQIEAIAEELRHQRESRERWAELVHDLTPVSRDAMDVATRELDELSAEVSTDDAVRLLRTTARALPQLEAMLAQLGGLADLLAELSALSGPAMATLTASLDQAERRGYFTFARGGMEIADKVVTSFGEEDVRALGDNVVLILNTVKEMTQPEVMTMLRRTALTAQHMDEPLEPPSAFALLRQMRDPEVRRGLARALTMLHTLGEETPATASQEGPH